MNTMLTITEILSFATAVYFLLRWDEKRHEMDIADSPEGASARKPISLLRCIAWTAAAFCAAAAAGMMPWEVSATVASVALYAWLRKPARRARVCRRAEEAHSILSKWFSRKAEAAAEERATAISEEERKAETLRTWVVLYS